VENPKGVFRKRNKVEGTRNKVQASRNKAQALQKLKWLNNYLFILKL
jgi:hypothetical protein